MDLRDRIREAFPERGAPTYRLSDAIIEDDYGDETFAFEEKWRTWTEIEDWQIAKSNVFFCFAPLDAALYVLPRFMLFVLDDIEGKLHKDHSDFGAGDSAVWFIQRLKKQGFRDTELSKAQIEVIEEFLGHIYRDYDYQVTVDVGHQQE
jgi:hypothetical protein